MSHRREPAPPAASVGRAKIKVCHLTSAHPANDVRIFWKECRSLAQAGFDVTLIAPGAENSRQEGVSIKGVAKAAKGRIRRATRTVWEVWKKAVQEDAAIYHLHDPELLWIAPLLRRSGAKIVYDMHEDLPLQVLAKPWIWRPIRATISAAISAIQPIIFKNCAVVFVPETYKPSQVLSILIRNYPRAEDFQIPLDTPPSDSEPFIGYVGAVGEVRGSLQTLKALSVLKERGIECSWLCVGGGDPDHLTQLRALSDQLGVSVEITGPMAPVEAYHHISRCICGLAILMPLQNYIEALPTKILEYSLLGMPIIVSDFPMNRAFIELADCGILVDPEDSMVIADAIENFINNPASARRKGENGRQYVLENLVWEREAEKLTAFYDTLLATRSL